MIAASVNDSTTRGSPVKNGTETSEASPVAEALKSTESNSKDSSEDGNIEEKMPEKVLIWMHL
jgi:hypothetical protein